MHLDLVQPAMSRPSQRKCLQHKVRHTLSSRPRQPCLLKESIQILLAGGSWVGSITAYSTKNVASYSNSSTASQIVTQFDFSCWDASGQPSFDAQHWFTQSLPNDPHWFDFEGYFGYSIDDEQHHVDGFSNIKLS